MSTEGKGRKVEGQESSPLEPTSTAPGKQTRAGANAATPHRGTPVRRGTGLGGAGRNSSSQRAGDWVMDAGSLAALGMSSEPERHGDADISSTSEDSAVCDPEHERSADHRDAHSSSGADRNVSTGREGSLFMGTDADLIAPKAGINRTGFVDHSDGAFLRAGPAEAGAPLLRRHPLPPATRVFVSGAHPDTSQWWYVTAFLSGEIVRGYVQDHRISTDLPEPTAKLHHLQSGDTAEKLAVQEFSTAVRDGHDLRYYENVLLKVNRDKGRAGILGSFQDPGVMGGGANNIQLIAGHRIWLVSPAYARTLEGTVPDGSLTNGAVAKVKRFAGHLEDLIASVTHSPSYLDEVAGELAQSIRDHLAEIIGITAAFLLAESISIAAAASPTGVGQLLAFLIQTLLATLGAAGMVDAAMAALAHGAQWMNLAWTAGGNEEKVATASREFLRMLVALAMAALSYKGAKANAGKSASILAKGGGGAMPALAAGGSQAVASTGVRLGPPNLRGGVGAGIMMMESKSEGPEAADEAGKGPSESKHSEASAVQTAGEQAAFSATEKAVIGEAQNILKSSAFAKIRSAYKAAKSVTIEVGGVTIQYEPGLPASGMTMFGEQGFLLGPEAFFSASELTKTVLHELHRLRTTSSMGGVSGDLAALETKAAFDFAERASKEIR